MDVNFVSGVSTDAYSTYNAGTKETKQAEVAKTNDEAVVYEKSETEKKATYTINKMSSEDRAALVKQLKADQEAREKSLLDIVSKAINGQAKTYYLANPTEADSDSIWKMIANGEFEVDEATRKQAEEDVSEDGYWGVNQTAQRLFDFASALAGDDVETMNKMQKAMLKGFDSAKSAWGKDLPDISNKTLEKANALFEEYYKSKEETANETVNAAIS